MGVLSVTSALSVLKLAGVKLSELYRALQRSFCPHFFNVSIHYPEDPPPYSALAPPVIRLMDCREEELTLYTPPVPANDPEPKYHPPGTPFHTLGHHESECHP